ncbi:hypothetical protein RFM26_02945 [Mesorhizobium sp. VK23B]|uniref:Transmembrane protein n=1 Tax=Mesorhizobium dulcispinae TaxID=3072316 RepID=A0ABU4X8A8_9HYPH|nr:MULTISPECIES: hypothetical protein [unclassified Mesorhizobium]MDX8464640.1 hypothetical protein [Mesorhizobium sp. VK23B]MDX8471026.1 hypothetical protein [Mesorhizobium sp. VK23A]
MTDINSKWARWSKRCYPNEGIEERTVEPPWEILKLEKPQSDEELKFEFRLGMVLAALCAGIYLLIAAPSGAAHLATAKHDGQDAHLAPTMVDNRR